MYSINIIYILFLKLCFRQIVEERLRRKEEQEEEYLNRCKEEVIVKTFPKTRQDFDMLYDQVQKWKTKEVSL